MRGCADDVEIACTGDDFDAMVVGDRFFNGFFGAVCGGVIGEKMFSNELRSYRLKGCVGSLEERSAIVFFDKAGGDDADECRSHAVWGTCWWAGVQWGSCCCRGSGVNDVVREGRIL